MHTPDIDIEQPPAEWIDPAEGFTFKPALIPVTRAWQAEKLTLCGLPADVFGDAVDPSFFIALGIRAGIANGISAQGNVNMLQRLVQHRPVRLDEPLRVRGAIDRVTPVPRGRTVHTDVWFEDEEGARVIEAPRTSLKPDPNKTGGRGAGERPAPVIDDVESLEYLSTHTLTPEIVKGYSSEGNSIHYDMEAANRAGFRAPLIGGGMGVHYLLNALWQHLSSVSSVGATSGERSSPKANFVRPWSRSPEFATGRSLPQPERLDLDIYFRRPIFWDDTFTVAAQVGAEGWRAMALIKEGKVLTEAWINGYSALEAGAGR